MKSWLHLRTRKKFPLRRGILGERGTQIVEFAVSLPLLVLFVVGIFDFTGALSLKQKLTNAARDAARVAAADPATDLGAAVPVSVGDAYQVVENYLSSENINNCGLTGTTPALSGTLTWKSPALTGCPGNTGLVVTINRGCATPIQGTGVDMVNTCVTIQYPYQWLFTSVSGLMGNSFITPANITTTATSFNENCAT